jgi:hypothetical protein
VRTNADENFHKYSYPVGRNRRKVAILTSETEEPTSPENNNLPNYRNFKTGNA